MWLKQLPGLMDFVIGRGGATKDPVLLGLALVLLPISCLSLLALPSDYRWAPLCGR